MLFSIFFLPKLTHAVDEIALQDTDVSVDISPENPEPYQDVTIMLSSYAFDLNKATIQWSSGANTVLAGIGRTSYTFKTSGPNTTTLVNVTINSADGGGKITKKITIKPSEIELLWESMDGYTPPFYRGKSFPSRESLIKVVAIPNASGKNNIVYNWKRGNSSVPGSSGYNKDSYLLTNSEINTSESVAVTASSVDSGYNAAKSVSIPMVQPEVIFYEKSPTEGILYGKALDDSTFVEADEMTLVAVPYFLAIKGNEDKFSYKWQINSKEIDTPLNRMELTIRPNSRGGYATIDLSFENLSAFFQKASGELKLNL